MSGRPSLYVKAMSRLAEEKLADGGEMHPSQVIQLLDALLEAEAFRDRAIHLCDRLNQQLAAVVAARDEACGIAEETLCREDSMYAVAARCRVDELRKVGGG